MKGFNRQEEEEEEEERQQRKKHLLKSLAANTGSGHCDTDWSILLLGFGGATWRLIRHCPLRQGRCCHRDSGCHQLPPPLPALHLHILALQIDIGGVVRGGGLGDDEGSAGGGG